MASKKNNTKTYPENKRKILRSKEMMFVCQCKNGHVFDYRERIKYPKDSIGYAPCQGMCPYCRSGNFSFIGNGINLYPIKFNYT